MLDVLIIGLIQGIHFRIRIPGMGIRIIRHIIHLITHRIIAGNI
jgi:hypothetical protein